MQIVRVRSNTGVQMINFRSHENPLEVPEWLKRNSETVGARAQQGFMPVLSVMKVSGHPTRSVDEVLASR